MSITLALIVILNLLANDRDCVLQKKLRLRTKFINANDSLTPKKFELISIE